MAIPVVTTIVQSKINERLIHSPLMTFLNANEVLYERKFGFRHNHSTTHALSVITEKLDKLVTQEILLVG